MSSDLQDSQAGFVLPPYPTSPASLIAAGTFYSAARDEINERCKFRDQVILSVMTAAFALIAFADPARIGKGLDGAQAYNSPFEGAVILLITSIVMATLFLFVARYLGYQNMKIAQLGYFITSGPAYHFQVYGCHELDSEPIGDQWTVSHKDNRRLAEIKPTLKKSLAHWDRWARGQETDKEIHKDDRNLFSQDKVYNYLIFRSSFGVILIYSIGLMQIFNDIGELSEIDPLSSLLLALGGCIVLLTPARTKWILYRAGEVKTHYQNKRDKVEDPSVV